MSDLTLTATQIAPVFPVDAEIFDLIAAVAITAGQAVYQNSAGKAALADADAGSGAEQFRGLALNSAGAGQAVSVLKRGHLYGFTLSGLAYDGAAWLSNTAGTLADAPSSANPVRAGRVVSLSDANLTKVLYVDAQWTMPAQSGSKLFISAEQTGTGSSQNAPTAWASRLGKSLSPPPPTSPPPPSARMPLPKAPTMPPTWSSPSPPARSSKSWRLRVNYPFVGADLRVGPIMGRTHRFAPT
jgi:hypothetical protein